ncbi:MAG: hypothetical protein CUN55_16085 [Phototrophicales bacterium]|nr:MAG: hypothetical protein CUN55_16085 [Phototrophicales bacterium]
MIPLLLGDATVNAQNNWSPNNPQNTNTYTATSENLYFSEVVKSEKTQEPRINTVRVIVIEFSLGAISHHATATMSHCDAMRFENEVSQAAAMSR